MAFMETRAVIAHDRTPRLTRKREISRISAFVPPGPLEKATPLAISQNLGRTNFVTLLVT